METLPVSKSENVYLWEKWLSSVSPVKSNKNVQHSITISEMEVCFVIHVFGAIVSYFCNPTFCKLKSSYLSYWKAINCKMEIITMSRKNDGKWWVVKLEGRVKIVYRISRAPIFKLIYILCTMVVLKIIHFEIWLDGC